MKRRTIKYLTNTSREDFFLALDIKAIRLV